MTRGLLDVLMAEALTLTVLVAVRKTPVELMVTVTLVAGVLATPVRITWPSVRSLERSTPAMYTCVARICGAWAAIERVHG